MIRTNDDADVARSIRAFQHHARVAKRLLAQAKVALAHLDPLRAAVGTTRTLALPMLRRAERRAEECRRELRYWLQAVDGILEVHRDHAAKRLGWKVPVAHDPSHDEQEGIRL